MIETPWFVLVGLCVAAVHVGAAASVRDARVRGLGWFFGIVLAVVGAEQIGQGMPTGLRALVWADLLIGWLVLGFAAAATHTPRVLAVAVALIATSLAGALLGAFGIAFSFAVAAWIVVPVLEGFARRRFVRVQLLVVSASVLGGLAHFLGYQQLAATALLCAGVLRAGVVPCHGWLTSLVDRAPCAISIAFLAPTLPLWPHVLGSIQVDPVGVMAIAAVLAVVAGVVGGLGSLVQRDARPALAWLWSGQSALALYAVLAGGSAGRDAGVLLAAVLSVSMAGSWAVLGGIEARRGRLDLESGGVSGSPRAAATFLLMGMAGAGMPATPGFVAEDMVLHASSAFGLAAGCGFILAAALHGIALMRIYFGVFAGRRPSTVEPDLVTRERLCATVVLVVLLLGGAWPRTMVTEDSPSAAQGSAVGH
jgi:hypothetical protein